jgi:prophage antirepressor-like protein
MSEIILFHFEQSEIRFVGTADKPEWIAADICKVLGISNPSETLSSFLDNQKGISTADTPSGKQEMLTVTESGMYRLIFKSRKPVAEKFQNWIFDEVLPSIRKNGGYQIEQDRQKLERKFLLTPSIKQIGEISKALKDSGVSPLYIERLAIANIKKHYPELMSESPQSIELKSLPAAKAFVNAGAIAEHLGWKCKSKKAKGFDAQRVNKKLSELGYQERICGKWSATQRAIDLNLCDRKPVDTNSRTQQDQLMWSVDILPILQEHVVAPNPSN